jgi:hypothetical protein
MLSEYPLKIDTDTAAEHDSVVFMGTVHVSNVVLYVEPVILPTVTVWGAPDAPPEKIMVILVRFSAVAKASGLAVLVVEPVDVALLMV